MSVAPAHIFVCTREQDYHDRYTEPDKLALTGGVEIEWPAPFWYVDAGAAMMLILLAAIDEGLAAGVYGVTVPEMEAFKDLLGIPEDVHVVAGVTLGNQARPEREPCFEPLLSAPPRARRGRALGTLVERLARRGSATTYNQYRDDRLCASASTQYLDARRERRSLLVGEAAGYRGARVCGHPVHVRAPADRRGPGRGDGDDRPPRRSTSSASSRRAALERRADASRHRDGESRADARARSRPACRSSRARPRARRDRRRADRGGGARARRTSAIRPMAARPRFRATPE